MLLPWNQQDFSENQRMGFSYKATQLCMKSARSYTEAGVFQEWWWWQRFFTQLLWGWLNLMYFCKLSFSNANEQISHSGSRGRGREGSQPSCHLLATVPPLCTTNKGQDPTIYFCQHKQRGINHSGKLPLINKLLHALLIIRNEKCKQQLSSQHQSTIVFGTIVLILV